ncbi:APC [Mytilus coruscus]|uniref:APC n=1 Tax=Mytilus coruscus TaxID=42192 RepID=A0A6J8AUF5_MYTCO|nr:APC [Mytilus coruscus]
MEQSFESVIGATGYAIILRPVLKSCVDQVNTERISDTRVVDKRETRVDDTGYNTTKLNSKHMTQSQVHFRSLNYDSDSDTEVERKPFCIDRNPTKHEHRVNVHESNDMYRGELDTPLFSPVRHSDYDYKTQRHHDNAYVLPKQNEDEFNIPKRYEFRRSIVNERKLPTLSSNEHVPQKHEKTFSMPKQNFDIYIHNTIRVDRLAYMNVNYRHCQAMRMYNRNMKEHLVCRSRILIYTHNTIRAGRLVYMSVICRLFFNTERHEPKQYTSNRRLPNHDYMPETRYHAHTYEKSAIGQYRNIEVSHAHVQANMNNCVPIVRDPQQCHVNTSTPMYVNPPGFDNRQEGYNPSLDTGA